MKERIIGAAVLVFVVVLVVPVFLDGPPGDAEVVSRNVPLPGQADQRTQTVVLDRDRDEPVPVAAEPALEPEPEPEPAKPKPQTAAEDPAGEAVAVSRPVPDPVPREKPAEKPPAAAGNSSPTGMWAVQVGSFGEQERADRLAAELRKQGFAAFLSKVSTGSGDMHRVRVGPQKDRESAEAMAERLKKAGRDGLVVPHP